MSYKFDTSHNAAGFTPGSQVYATWGQPRAIKGIAIHWWGDPNTNPTYEGVISHFESPSAGVSAHFVATGTGRRVAQLVNFQDAAWATNSANPWTIAIECDPRCRPEDYDVVAELIAQIRSAYGDLPLYPHKQFVATACPGNYDLVRLDRLARTKDGSGDWGNVKNKGGTTAPKPTQPTQGDDMITRKGLDAVFLAYLGRIPDAGAYTHYVGKFTVDFVVDDVKKSAEYATHQKAVAAQATQLATLTNKVASLEKQLSEATRSPSNGSFTQNDRTILQDVQKGVQTLLGIVQRIFK